MSVARLPERMPEHDFAAKIKEFMGEKNLGNETELILREGKQVVTPPKIYDHLADQYSLEISPKSREGLILPLDIALVLVDQNGRPLCGEGRANELLSAHESNLMERLAREYFSPSLLDSSGQKIEFSKRDGLMYCMRGGKDIPIESAGRELFLQHLDAMDYIVIGQQGAMLHNPSK